MANIYKEIDDLYTKSSYFTRYAGDILISFIICLIVFVVFSYFKVMNDVQPIINDWNNQRCSPSVIPFAGIINPPQGTSAFDFTAQNFESCTQNILSEIAEYALAPFYYLMQTITETFKELADALNDVRALFNRMRNSIKGVGEDLFARNLNIMLPIVKLFNMFRSVLGKVQATMVSAIFTVYGGFITLESFFMFTYELIINLMWTIVSIILALFGVAWFFPPALVAGLGMAAFLAVLLIPIVVMIVIMNNIFGAAGLKSPPPVPGYCFDGDTKIVKKNGKKTNIKDLKLGDVLHDGSIVTSIMKSTSRGSDIYKLNGIIVTGNHMVFNSMRGWIRARDHPSSEYIDDYRKEYVYCINTNTKTIKIKDCIFADWDEIDEEDMSDIRKNCDFIPFNFDKSNIHHYLDGGLHPDTFIDLEDGRSVKISEVDVNDILYTGEHITGIVKIDTSDINEYNKIIIDDQEVIICNKNVELSVDNLGSDLENLSIEKTESPKCSYHLITDTGYFNVNGIRVGDYNRCIDRYLSEENIRNSLSRW
uniref:Vint domain-containing protein n=1 Tax=viral metagenome TaxID=1070528 RepID=A0A6C0CRY8_9ZZZZ